MKNRPPPAFEICILAGGLSRRMGRDKSRLRLGQRTMLGHIRTTAKTLGLPVRVIRRDAVPRCGPLGGVFTALKTSQAGAVMFLACDMPFITGKLLRAVRQRFGPRDRALFVRSGGGAGFPFLLRRAALDTVTAQIWQREFSLHALAQKLKARKLKLPSSSRTQLQNVNTPAELESAKRVLAPGEARRGRAPAKRATRAGRTA